MGSGDWDIGLGAILVPPDGSGRRSFRPAVALFTRGEVPVQEVAIRCVIQDEAGQAVYEDAQQLRVGPEVQEAEVAFRTWTPAQFGAYRLTAEFSLQGDVDPANDRSELNLQIAPMVEVAAEAGIAEDAPGRGVACADVDGDGDLDLYVANWGAPDILYLNDGKGHFADRTAEAGLGDPGRGRGVCFLDADNDGDPDLYVGIEGQNRFYRNLGGGRFAEATEEAGVGDTRMARSVVTADIEGDGDLDLYVVNGDGPNRLYRNRGDGRFEEGVDGMGVGDPGPGRSAVFGDIDSDGDPDLYLVNYGQANRLYRNDQRSSGMARFTEISKQAGGGDEGKGNGAVFGDLDNDGDLDLVVANEGWPLVYQNQGDGSLAEVAKAAGLVQWGNWASPVLADFDSDGNLDCYLSSYGAKDAFYANTGSGRFTDRSGDLGRAVGRRGFGVAAGDYDGNGTVDLYVAADGLDLLYANSSRGTHYLTVEVVGAQANRDGIGARVRVLSRGLAQIQEVSGGSGYCSQGSRQLVFGLGERATFDSLEVWWPGGERLVLAGGTADRVVRIVQSQATAVEETRLLSKPLEWVTLEQNVPNPFNEETAIQFTHPAAGWVKLAIYDIRGRRVRSLVDGWVEAGAAAVRWEGRDDQRRPVASGIYLCRLSAGKTVQVRKLVLLR
ncbi:MAG: VCBS repeat-containing protein [Candidatus Latescibacteria bacterium]|nr:VCBS repeat-containing protein [Candidatus Latescibacterota bacterium]